MRELGASSVAYPVMALRRFSEQVLMLRSLICYFVDARFVYDQTAYMAILRPVRRHGDSCSQYAPKEQRKMFDGEPACMLHSYPRQLHFPIRP
ncbi:MAG: hypothetical protein ACKOAU_13385 [Pirellula sp.]